MDGTRINLSSLQQESVCLLLTKPFRVPHFGHRDFPNNRLAVGNKSALIGRQCHEE